MNLSLFIARRHLLRRQGGFSSFIIRLAILATALSVATMVVSVSFVTGFKYEIREKLFSFWGHVHVSPFSPNASTIITPDPVKRSRDVETSILHIPHVKEMVPFAVRPVIINANKLMEGLQLKGVNEAYRLPANVGFKGAYINYSDSDYARQVMLSETTADRLRLNVGDELQLYFLEPGSITPRIRKVRLAGIFHTGMDEVDHDYGICDLRMLQRINNWQANDINGYQLNLDNEQYADSVAAHVAGVLQQTTLYTNTMKDIFPNIFDWLQLQDVNVRIIITIMSIVAIINLAAALLILIVEQARMIGILKAQGMSLKSMRSIFLYHSGIIAGFGILLGNLIGLGICWLQKTTNFIHLSESTYYVKYVPVRIYWWQPLMIDLVTLLLCILCMWLPALYIRRVQPAKVLQFK